MHLKSFLSLASLLLAFAQIAHAQEAYPTKTIRFVNNFPPGGPSDILARSLGQVTQEVLKQTVVVENKPGAGGNLGAAEVAKSPADGYTVFFGIDSVLTVNPRLYSNLGFKVSDLKPVMIIASSGLMLGVPATSGHKTLADFIKAAKAKPQNMSSGGNGSPGHLAVEVFTDSAGGQYSHIPYKGNTPAVTAVVSGEVDGGILATPGFLPHVTSGKVSALAVTSSKRSPLAPNVPTVRELGFPNLEQTVYYIALVPAATPDAIVDTLYRTFNDALKRPDVQKRLQALDMQVEALGGAQASARLNEVSARFAPIVKATGMKVD
jgi:tripartite-type tricarboxylate transporter receptor subunit TctC